MKTTAISPLAIGLLIAALLLLLVAVVVRNTGTPSQLQNTAAASLGQYPTAAPVAVLGPELPAFTVNVEAPIRSDLPADPEWLTTVTDPAGVRWIYAGAWLACPFIDGANLTYAAGKADPALAAWAELAPRKQDQIAKLCAVQSAVAVAPASTVAPTEAPTAVPAPIVVPLPTEAPTAVPAPIVVPTAATVLSSALCGRVAPQGYWAGADYPPERVQWEALDPAGKWAFVNSCKG